MKNINYNNDNTPNAGGREEEVSRGESSRKNPDVAVDVSIDEKDVEKDSVKVVKGDPSLFRTHSAALGFHLSLMITNISEFIVLNRKVLEDKATALDKDAHLLALITLVVSCFFFMWALVGVVAEHSQKGLDPSPTDYCFRCGIPCFKKLASNHLDDPNANEVFDFKICSYTVFQYKTKHRKRCLNITTCGLRICFNALFGRLFMDEKRKEMLDKAKKDAGLEHKSDYGCKLWWQCFPITHGQSLSILYTLSCLLILFDNVATALTKE